MSTTPNPAKRAAAAPTADVETEERCVRGVEPTREKPVRDHGLSQVSASSSDRVSDEMAPARGYTWPPFEPGNEAATRHGAYSPRRVDPLAGELVARALDDPDLAHLTAPAYRPALWAWGRAEAQVQLFAEHVERVGLDFGDQAVAAAHTAFDRAERRAERARARLGLDPLSRARLGRDHAAARVDVVEVLTRMAEQRDQAAAAVPSTPTTAPPVGVDPTAPEEQR